MQWIWKTTCSNENKSKKVSGFTLTNIIKKLDDFSEKVKVGASFSETTKQAKLQTKKKIYKKLQVQIESNLKHGMILST